MARNVPGQACPCPMMVQKTTSDPSLQPVQFSQVAVPFWNEICRRAQACARTLRSARVSPTASAPVGAASGHTVGPLVQLAISSR